MAWWRPCIRSRSIDYCGVTSYLKRTGLFQPWMLKRRLQARTNFPRSRPVVRVFGFLLARGPSLVERGRKSRRWTLSTNRGWIQIKPSGIPGFGCRLERQNPGCTLSCAASEKIASTPTPVRNWSALFPRPDCFEQKDRLVIVHQTHSSRETSSRGMAPVGIVGLAKVGQAAPPLLVVSKT